jgi:glycosyltransferase involved in cell wall biosynthesis
MAIKVLHLRDTHEIGGPGKTILETISHIDRSEFELHIGVFTTRNEKDESPFVRAAKDRGCKIHLIQSSHKYDLRVFFKTANLIKNLGIDIIHTHEALSDVVGYLAAKLTKKPIITTLHGWIVNTMKDKIRIYLDKLIIKRFNCVIAVSESMEKQILNDGVPQHIIRVLHNCIVTSHYNKNGTKGFLRNVIKNRNNGVLIGTIGRLSAEKGHKDFIEAASIIRRKGYEAHFVLIGDGQEKENLVKMTNDLGLDSYVTFTGYIRNVQDVYRDLDLMVLPSYTEGLPNVVLESLMMDVPVIATNVGGTSEIIKNNETGVLISPHSPQQIANEIINYLDNPLIFKEMTIAGRSLVINEFDFAERTKKLEAIYQDMMRNRGGS